MYIATTVLHMVLSRANKDAAFPWSFMRLNWKQKNKKGPVYLKGSAKPEPQATYRTSS